MNAQETEALKALADIATPPPVPWLPQTWGWAALGVALLAVAAWALWRWHRRREANRYRREALAELARLEDVAGIPPLLKRTALVAWPRKEVAALSGAQWVEFLRRGAEIAEPLARLLDDGEYRPQDSGADDMTACREAARRWIEEHRVPA